MPLNAWVEAARFGAAGMFIFFQGLLAIYGLHRYLMVALYYRYKDSARSVPKTPEIWPRVTVQLPVYNEIYVVERLIDAVCNLDYPLDRLEVQVLDDSDDETTGLARARAEHFRQRGVDVRVIHRSNRDGFKAGALAAGMARAKGEFLAIFDADFLPQPDFLRRAVIHFEDEDIGMVQARWGHVNRDYSIFTQIQGVLLDSHFLIEHTARSRSGRFFNFNGTAGIWRKRCIAEAGGWQADTLTEDLDLSYRAQLAGWKFEFLPDLVAPAELPVNINAFKSQQRRWAKGSIQTALKMLPRVWRSPYPLRVKIESVFHLTSNITYLLFLASALLLPPLLLVDTPIDARTISFWALLFLAGTGGVCLFFVVSQRAQGISWTRSLLRVPASLALGMGMSFSQARAVIEAMSGVMGDWERTPKYAIRSVHQPWRDKRYVGKKLFEGVGEFALVAYFVAVIWLSVSRGEIAPIPFLAVLVLGLGHVGWLSWRARPISHTGPRPASQNFDPKPSQEPQPIV